MKRFDCFKGYDPYDSFMTRVWVEEHVIDRDFAEVGEPEFVRLEWNDAERFFDHDHPKFVGVDYVPSTVATRPRRAEDWTALAPVADMNDPFDGLAPADFDKRRKFS